MSEAKARELLQELVEAWGPDGGWSAGGVDRWNKAIDAGRAYLASVPAPAEPTREQAMRAGQDLCVALAAKINDERAPVFATLWAAWCAGYDAAPAAEPVAQQPPPLAEFIARQKPLDREIGNIVQRNRDRLYESQQPEAPTLADDALVERIRAFAECAWWANCGWDIPGDSTQTMGRLAVKAAARIESDAALLAASRERERAMRDELSNIANARRFDRKCFYDDRSFADWAQSRARHTLALAAPDSAASPTGGEG